MSEAVTIVGMILVMTYGSLDRSFSSKERPPYVLQLLAYTKPESDTVRQIPESANSQKETTASGAAASCQRAPM